MPTCRQRGTVAALLAGFSGILITVTNPMDINNYYLCTKTGIPRERCIGFGGQLDSARFGIALRDRNISGFPFVLGEHGEHQVPVFSRLGKEVGMQQREEILSELRGASMEVIKGKGGTVFGPALHLAHLARMVLMDTRELAVCSRASRRGVRHFRLFARRPGRYRERGDTDRSRNGRSIRGSRRRWTRPAGSHRNCAGRRCPECRPSQPFRMPA